MINLISPLSRIKSGLVVLVLVAAVAAVPAQHSQAAMVQVRMAFSTWTGYGALVVAAQQHLWAKYGLNVTYTVIEDPTARRDALRASRLDGVATTVDTFSRWAGQNVPMVQVFGIDKSQGGDGIVSRKSITSVKQLKGKTVALNVGSTSEWFFDYVLQQNGMSIADVNVLDMPSSGVAGSTFVAGKVDAAVTWEPWLDRAQKAPFGHVLVSSKAYPNIIVDDFGFRPAFIQAHPDVISNFIKGYYDAVALVKAKNSAAIAIVGKYVGEDAKGVAYDFSTVPLMNLAASKAYFGTAANHGPIYDIAAASANFWLANKIIRHLPDYSQIIDPSYLAKM
jgi:NitT/TauT family transport system substrate-binding protein